MRHYFLIVLTCAGISAAGQVAKYSNEFLEIGVGARALGMGNANVVSSEGVQSGYWNPAGLIRQQNDIEVGLMHAEYFAGLAKYDFVGVSKRIDSNSVAGISILRFGVEEIANTLGLVDANGNWDYNRIKIFNAVDFAALLSYARNLPALKGVELGGNFKVIRRRIGDFAGAWGFGLDAGARYNHGKWRFGAMARDITGTFNAWSYSFAEEDLQVLEQTGNELPVNSVEVTLPKLVLGASRSVNLWNDRISILGEVDLINTFDGLRNTVIKSDYWSLEPAFGIEVGYKGLVYLRGGIGNVQRELNDRATVYIVTARPNLGLGIHYRMFTLDYALTDIGDRSAALYSNVFSLKIDINAK